MATGGTCNGDYVVNGNLRLSGLLTPTRTRADILSQVDLAEYVIPMWKWKLWDSAILANLPAPLGGGTDDLGMVAGTWGTDPPTIQSGDVKGTTTSRWARAQIILPPEYVAGQTVIIRFHAGMITTVAGTSALLDLVCYAADNELGLSADLASAAVTMNSLTFADIDFTITPTALVPGTLLDMRVDMTITDAVGGGAVIGCIGKASLLCDVR